MGNRRIHYAAQVMFWPAYDLPHGSYGGASYGSPEFVSYSGIDPVSATIEGLGQLTGTVMSGIQQSQANKRADVCGTAAGYKSQYMACKKGRQAAGKPVYPGNPGKGPFYTDCRSEYKKWQKYKGLCEESGASMEAAGLEDAGMLPEDEGSSMSPLLLAGGGVALLLLVGTGIYLATERRAA